VTEHSSRLSPVIQTIEKTDGDLVVRNGEGKKELYRQVPRLEIHQLNFLFQYALTHHVYSVVPDALAEVAGESETLLPLTVLDFSPQQASDLYRYVAAHMMPVLKSVETLLGGAMSIGASRVEQQNLRIKSGSSPWLGSFILWNMAKS
jgi:hypothetical protein